MTEKEAKEILTLSDNMKEKMPNLQEVYAIAVKALEEIEQYRSIGTVEEIRDILNVISEGQDDIDKSGISTGLLHTLLEYAQYSKIGTVDECREAMEKQRTKKPIQYKETNRADCPVCRGVVRGINKPFGNWCSSCGQCIDWSDN